MDSTFKADMDNRFDYHAPSEAKRNRHEKVRSSLREVANLARDMPPCRETSLFLTKLEEAMFWGNAAIARNDWE